MLFRGAASRNLFISKQVLFGVFVSLNIRWQKSDNIIGSDDELQKELKLTKKKNRYFAFNIFREDSN